jgi:hypothetical protein
MTITEALAELKTLRARIEKKQKFVHSYCARQRVLQDCYVEEGGTPQKITEELQAIGDLEKRIVRIRLAILAANLSLPLTIQKVTQSVQGWLTWRREIADSRKGFVSGIIREVARIKHEAVSRGGEIGDGPAKNNFDLVIQVDESSFNKENEHLVEILGELDGQLSVINATSQIDV